MVDPEDASTKEWITTNKVEVDEKKNAIIATLDVNVCLAREPASSLSTTCTALDSYHMGGSACALVTKGFLMTEKTADLAI